MDEVYQFEQSTDSISNYGGGASVEDDGGPINKIGTRQFLAQHDWPSGLIEALIHSIEFIPMRYFILDNSGSMIISDARRVGIHAQKKT